MFRRGDVPMMSVTIRGRVTAPRTRLKELLCYVLRFFKCCWSPNIVLFFTLLQKRDDFFSRMCNEALDSWSLQRKREEIQTIHSKASTERQQVPHHTVLHKKTLKNTRLPKLLRKICCYVIYHETYNIILRSQIKNKTCN